MAIDSGQRYSSYVVMKWSVPFRRAIGLHRSVLQNAGQIPFEGSKWSTVKFGQS